VFKRKTIFILGAGSSYEVGLPVGKDLATAIGKKMDIRFEAFNQPIGEGDFQLYAQLTNNFRETAIELQNAAWLIRDGIAFSQSIDDFLDQHRTNIYVNPLLTHQARNSRSWFSGSWQVNARVNDVRRVRPLTLSARR
jgi:hypothetical protein